MAWKEAIFELYNPRTKEVLTAKRGTKIQMRKLKEAMGAPWQFRKRRTEV